MESRATRPGEETRIPLEQAIALRFKQFGDFVDELSTNVSTGGMFIRARQPQPIGSVFEFELPGDDELPPIAGKVQVAWVRRRSEEAGRPIGMGVRFVELENQSRRRIAQLVAAYEAQGGRPLETGPADPTPVIEAATPGPSPAAPAAPAPKQAPVTSFSEPRPSLRAERAPGKPQAQPPVPEGVDRQRSRAPWILLAIVLVAALAAFLFLPSGLFDTLPAAARPAMEPVAVDGATDAVAPAVDGAVSEPEQVQAVRDWARAWSEQRVDGYLDRYSPRFAPPDELDRAAWERQRRARILAPRWIKVGVALIELEEVGSGRSRVRFVQAYESDSYSDVVRKVLDLEREDDGWKILLETVEP